MEPESLLRTILAAKQDVLCVWGLGVKGPRTQIIGFRLEGLGVKGPRIQIIGF